MLTYHCYVGRTRDKGRIAIQAILALKRTLADDEKELEHLTQRLTHAEANASSVVTATIQDMIDTLQRKCRRTRSSINNKISALGVPAHTELLEIMQSQFLQTRMNARAIKLRIRERLRARRLEIERLQQFNHNIANGNVCCILFFLLLTAVCRAKHQHIGGPCSRRYQEAGTCYCTIGEDVQ